MTLLAIDHASKSYGGTPALRSVALELRAGEVHALMGENGAGKSTLIKILAGVVAADEAVIRLRGRPITIRSAAEAFAHGLRFIHQESRVVPQLSVAENLFLGRPYPRRFGVLVNWPALNAAASIGLARLGIDHIDPKAQIARLSVGDQMLVKIAGALLSEEGDEASVYVMDEPTAALTGEESARLFRVIEALKAQGCAILYVSHRIDEVLAIADRVTVVRDGRSVATRTIAELDQRTIVQLMTGRDLTQAYPPRGQPPGDEIALEVRELRSRRLRDVRFQVREGEILGIAGLAGSGQSELLRVLMGADRQRRRNVVVGGRPQARLDPAAAWSQGLAYVPTERRSQGLVLSRSVGDNVTLPHLTRLSRGGVILDRRREERSASALADDVRLKATGPQQRTYQLSGGNQQKTVFARALAGAPKVLLLDEPTRGVDIGAKYDIYALIRRLSDAGAAILLASSDRSELLGMCDRILVLRAQRPFAIVATAGLTPEDLLNLCYGQPLDA